MATFLWIAFFAWLVRKIWKKVQLKNAQIDFEAAWMAGLRKELEDREK